MNSNGLAKTDQHLRESLAGGHLAPEDFDLTEMAHAFMGTEWVRNLNPKNGKLQESAGDAVAFSAFAQLWGQIVITALLEDYNSPEFVFSKAVPTVPTNYLGRERIPGVGEIGDEFTVVEENDEYPLLGVSPQHIDIGPKKKRGGRIAVTRETIRSQAGPEVLRKCRKLGWWLGANREKRVIDALIDENGGATNIDNGGHRYHWNNQSYASYQSSAPWVNIKTTNALVNWANLDAAWLLLKQMVDPITGEPIDIMPTTLIVQPPGYHKALEALRAIEVRSDTNATAGTPTLTTIGPSPIGGQYTLLSSSWLQARSATDTDWWFGDPGKAVNYFSAWDIETEERGPESEDAFKRDVLWQTRAGECGLAQVVDPRFLIENQA